MTKEDVIKFLLDEEVDLDSFMADVHKEAKTRAKNDATLAAAREKFIDVTFDYVSKFSDITRTSAQEKQLRSLLTQLEESMKEKDIKVRITTNSKDNRNYSDQSFRYSGDSKTNRNHKHF